MLNLVIILGRITQDLEIRQTQGGVAVLSFTVAVDRGYVKQGEERQTDFINCVACRFEQILTSNMQVTRE